MKILIAVSSKKYSKPTLRVGMNVSRAFKASTTIVDVGKKINRSEEHTSELQSLVNLVCRLLLEKKKKTREQKNKSKKE